jgi:hypothetical protein
MNHNSVILLTCLVALAIAMLIATCGYEKANNIDDTVKQLEMQIDSLKRTLREYELTDWRKIDTLYLWREKEVVKVLRDSIERVPMMGANEKLLLWKAQIGKQ